MHYPILPTYILLLLSLGSFLVLALGGDWLTKGSVSLALRLNIKPIVIALTVVAASTSMPEWITTVVGAFHGHDDLALGNIIGSNLANLGLVLAAVALISPITVEVCFVKKEMSVLLGAVFLFVVLGLMGAHFHGVLNWRGGSVLLLAGVGYFVFVLGEAKRVEPQVQKECAVKLKKQSVESLFYCFFFILLGTVALAVAADVLVGSMTQLAMRMGISQLLVGLTVLALGTSLPEMATCVMAALRRQHEIIAGNLIGSNIFNLLWVGGGVSTLFPLKVSHSLCYVEFPAMVLLTLIVWLFFFTGGRLSRVEGIVLLGVYVGSLLFCVFFERGT